jgi:hypothetical protein
LRNDVAGRQDCYPDTFVVRIDIEYGAAGWCMPKEIFPSSYECDCGHQSHFFESTVRAMKALSRKRNPWFAHFEKAKTNPSPHHEVNSAILKHFCLSKWDCSPPLRVQDNQLVDLGIALRS